jgi:GGDEF domain-containing protein
MLATRLRDAFRAPFRLDDTDIGVTASIGIALADAGMSAADVVAMADNRMYAAKRRRGHASPMSRHPDVLLPSELETTNIAV